jgi:hypothetical protein
VIGPAMRCLAVDLARYAFYVGAGAYKQGYMGRNYRRGYSTRNYHVTGEHEAEALAAERAKKPNRIGLFVLKLLGGGRPVHEARGVDRATPTHPHPQRHRD